MVFNVTPRFGCFDQRRNAYSAQGFWRAGASFTFISLDASLQLILRKLREAEVANPTSVDAAAFMEDALGEERAGKAYFEDYCTDRIKTMHPQSRFGVFPYPPRMNSDFFGLYYGLRAVAHTK